MKSISKKITAVILSAVMLVTGLFFAPAKSEAAGFNYILDEYSQQWQVRRLHITIRLIKPDIYIII